MNLARRATVIASGLAFGAAPAAGAFAATGPQVAITFDDLPVHARLPPNVTRLEIGRRVIAALQSAGAPPTYGFVNAVGTVQEPGSAAVLTAWRAAGWPLGNHTWSHMNLNTAALTSWEADVEKNEPLLTELMPNGGWRWLRYPYLAEGDTPAKRDAARAFLAARGYRVAQVTMSFSDFAYNDAYARCAAAHDAPAIARMEAAWIGGAKAELARAHAMSTTLYGRDIPYVLLMHLGAFSARMLPRLMALYREEDVQLVTLEQAEADPVYREDVDLALPYQPETLEDRLKARGEAAPAAPDISWLQTICPDKP